MIVDRRVVPVEQARGGDEADGAGRDVQLHGEALFSRRPSNTTTSNYRTAEQRRRSRPRLASPAHGGSPRRPARSERRCRRGSPRPGAPGGGAARRGTAASARDAARAWYADLVGPLLVPADATEGLQEQLEPGDLGLRVVLVAQPGPGDPAGLLGMRQARNRLLDDDRARAHRRPHPAAGRSAPDGRSAGRARPHGAGLGRGAAVRRVGARARDARSGRRGASGPAPRYGAGRRPAAPGRGPRPLAPGDRRRRRRGVHGPGAGCALRGARGPQRSGRPGDRRACWPSSGRRRSRPRCAG